MRNLGDSGSRNSSAATRNDGRDITSRKIRHELYTKPFVVPPISEIIHFMSFRETFAGFLIIHVSAQVFEDMALFNKKVVQSRLNNYLSP